MEAEEAKAAKNSREIFDSALDARLVSRVRPSSLTTLKPSKVLRRSDCKDIHKRSTVKKSRYMTVFPGQLGNLKEGRLGSLAKLDTQNPVMYVEYPGFGRLKLCGTIVRSRATRYFTLNVKSKDRLNLEDWFDSMIVFARYFWVGTVAENPGEEPLPFPEELRHVQVAAGGGGDGSRPEETLEGKDSKTSLTDYFGFSVAAEEGAKPMKVKEATAAQTSAPNADVKKGRSPGNSSQAPIALDDSDDDDDDDDENDAARVARPRRASAKGARYDFSESDDRALEEEDREDERVFRGRITATVAKEAAPMKAPKKRASFESVGKGSPRGSNAKRVKGSDWMPKEKTPPSEVVSFGDDDEDRDEPLERRPAAQKQTSLLGFLGGKTAAREDPREEPVAAPARRVSAGAPRAAAVAPRPSKKFVLDSDDDSDDSDDSDEEEKDSDFEA